MWGYNFSEIEIEGKHVYVVLERVRERERTGVIFCMFCGQRKGRHPRPKLSAKEKVSFARKNG